MTGVVTLFGDALSLSLFLSASLLSASLAFFSRCFSSYSSLILAISASLNFGFAGAAATAADSLGRGLANPTSVKCVAQV